MQTKTKIIIFVASVVVAFACGRFLAPEKIKIETKIVEVEKKTTKTNKNKKVKIVVVERPDGTKETTKTIDSNTDSLTTQDKTSVAEKKEEITKSSSRLSLNVLGGIGYNPTTVVQPVFGGHISRDLIGPVSIGVWGLSNISGGVSIGVSF